MKKALFLFVSILLSSPSFSQKDTVMLLADKGIQIEATDAVNDMYNFKFEKAEIYFKQLKDKHPEHPMPYFLLALSNWWKMVPEMDNEVFVHFYEKDFLNYLDITIAKGEKLFDEDEQNLEAAFFLCAAYGFKGRFFSDNGDYIKAAFAGKSALHYLNYTKGKGDLSPEVLFGESLFNYYAEWIKEEYPLLKPLVNLFPKGNKVLGLQQLKDCANNAFYTRIEAESFLMRIYTFEENKPREAYPYAKYLAQSFPDNPYFQRNYARLCWQLGYYADCEKICYDINYKVNIGMPGYEENTGRYVCYFLGIMLYNRGDFEKAKFYFLKTTAFAESANLTKMGYSLSAYYYLGMIERRVNNNSEAEKYFLNIIKLGDDKQDESSISWYSDAAYQLGDLYEKLKFYPRAETYYKKAIDRVEKLNSEEYFNKITEIKNKSNAGLSRLKDLKK